MLIMQGREITPQPLVRCPGGKQEWKEDKALGLRILLGARL